MSLVDLLTPDPPFLSLEGSPHRALTADRAAEGEV